MSRLKTRRADDYPIPVQITTAPIKPKHTSQAEVADLLKKLPFVKVLDELGGLVIRAATQDKLDVAVINAMDGARRQGMYLEKSKRKATVAERMGSPATNFEACRQRAVERTAAKANARGDKPKAVCKIGTKFGEWETISKPYYDTPRSYGVVREAKINVKCSCGDEHKRTFKSLNRGLSKSCQKCSNTRTAESRKK